MTEGNAPDSVSEDPTSPSNYRPGYDIAAERILRYIVAERLAPGSRLPTEKDLADIVQMSRTVVREAVKILSALGRLSVQKGRGMYVAAPADPLWRDSFAHFLPTDVEQVYKLFEFRSCVETTTARLAARRASPSQVSALREAALKGAEAAASGDVAGFGQADQAFHIGIGAAASNMFLAANLDSVQRLQQQTTMIGLAGTPSGSLTVASEQHLSIVTAIAAGDEDKAAMLMDEHIQMTLQQFQRSIRERLFPLGNTP